MGSGKALFYCLMILYTRLEMDTPVAVPVDGVLCLGWTDNNAVLALTTVHAVHLVTDAVLKNRQSQAGKSTGAENARKALDHAIINAFNIGVLLDP